MNDPRCTLSMSPRERLRQLPQHIGTWSQHVQSWLGSGHRRVLLIRYEDLLENTERVFGNVMRFLGRPTSADQLRSALEAASFPELSRQEGLAGFRERPRSASRFFRQGTAGGWKEVLTTEQSLTLEENHGHTMARLGYRSLSD